jgi:hypothetical protein
MGTVRSNREQREEVVDEWADGQGVQHSADADRPPERPAERDHGQFDRGPDRPDGVTAVGQPGHQAVPRTGTEPGPDVQAGRHPIDDDAGAEQRHAWREMHRGR